MSTAEILEQLPKLNVMELREIHDRILQLEEEGLLSGRGGPTEEEKALLDRELDDYSRDKNPGSSWEDVEARLKR
jgi:putative addiction module component (TIGR02574 family)